MVLVGNPFSGVGSAPELLPQPVGGIGQLMPPGAGGNLLRSTGLLRRRRRRRPRRGARRLGRAGALRLIAAAALRARSPAPRAGHGAHRARLDITRRPPPGGRPARERALR